MARPAPAWLLALFEPIGPVDIRPMFGGHSIKLDDLPIAIEAYGQVWLKADAENAPAFEAAGSRPFQYEKAGRTMVMSFWLLPEAALDDPDALREWVRSAREAALRARHTKGKKTRKSSP
jgi:DNA transformation protein